jgi:predicted amidohydrolase YtcJ
MGWTRVSVRPLLRAAARNLPSETSPHDPPFGPVPAEKFRCKTVTALIAGLLGATSSAAAGEVAGQADLILHGGKVVTVDRQFTVRQALAVQGERILRVGTDEEVLAARGAKTEVLDLEGKMVLPGLMDSHTHPVDASLIEFDHPIPTMETIEDVLSYIRSRAAALKEGEWIVVRQVFITRLKEQRYPTRAELDEAAPRHPTIFATGPDASLNTLAMKLSGIDREFRVTDGGPGFAEKDARAGEPTGILRGCTRYVKMRQSSREPTREERCRRLEELLRDYNTVGITSIGDGDTSTGDLELYRSLLEKGNLTVRVFASRGLDTLGPIEGVLERIREIGRDPLRKGSLMLRVGGVKAYLDGGMLTGSAYMREPWGVSKMYGIDDPTYRGVLFIPKDRLLPMVRTAVECGLQFTAHSVGDGAVHTLLDVYEEISKTMPIRQTRPCLTHANFMSREAIEKLARVGAVANIQPAWLYLDARTLTAHFGYGRLRYFQPLKSIFEAGGIVGGGSDHMQKIGSRRAINPYDPFLGMWVALTRKARWYDGQLHPEEALSREQVIRFYTIQNAYLLFQEDATGSLEEGKLADFIVIDNDLLTCPLDTIPETRVLRTYLGGRKVHERR